MTAPVKPFVKWAGGKGKQCVQLLSMLPTGVDGMCHVEPFVGGGAMFFARQPKRAVLHDSNHALIATYMAVKDEIESLILRLEVHANGHNEGYYYAARKLYNAIPSGWGTELGALFIYLNKTCFNGLHRVNSSGDFNTPMGRYAAPVILDEPTLRAAHTLLNQSDVVFCANEFQDWLVDDPPLGDGDFVYLDPPYEPTTETSNFTGYTHNGFTRDDQALLAQVFRELDKRGAALMLSNSDVPFIRELYDGFRIDTIQGGRGINSKADKRGPVTELVVRNY